MPRTHHATVTCQICHQQKRRSEVLPAELVRSPVVDLIRAEHPDWSETGFICLSDLDHYRTRYVEQTLEAERGELTTLEEDVLRSMEEHELLAANVDAEFDEALTFGQRMADKLAYFGGSWTFLIFFAVFLAIWIVINSLLILARPFDPYPFILLNLVLSCLAAIQAPVILMSQNRQEAKDRRRGEYDYRVNLKAELEIRQLHAKLDLLLTHQWHRLLEIQEIQIELIEELAGRRNTD
jgi:uncharacterized membrane protein